MQQLGTLAQVKKKAYTLKKNLKRNKKEWVCQIAAFWTTSDKLKH